MNGQIGPQSATEHLLVVHALLNVLSRLKRKLISFNTLRVLCNVAFSNNFKLSLSCHLRRFKICGIPNISSTSIRLIHFPCDKCVTDFRRGEGNGMALL